MCEPIVTGPRQRSVSRTLWRIARRRDQLCIQGDLDALSLPNVGDPTVIEIRELASA